MCRVSYLSPHVKYDTGRMAHGLHYLSSHLTPLARVGSSEGANVEASLFELRLYGNTGPDLPFGSFLSNPILCGRALIGAEGIQSAPLNSKLAVKGRELPCCYIFYRSH